MDKETFKKLPSGKLRDYITNRLKDTPSTPTQITEATGKNYAYVCIELGKMYKAGLVEKKYYGHEVFYSLK